MNKWRFIDSGAGNPSANMAIDKSMFLDFCDQKIPPTFRIYRWSKAAYSLGCFQDAEKELDVQGCLQAGIPFVKRITAGGVIFHEQELTYSLVCSPFDLGIRGSVENSFRIICSFLIAAFRKIGLKAGFAAEKERYDGTRSSFCFASQAKYDILINGRKVGGNAQKRSKGVIFQHGSIPLSFDLKRATCFLREKPLGLEAKICSLEEAANTRIEFDFLSGILKSSFQETFAVDLLRDEFGVCDNNLSPCLEEHVLNSAEASMAG